MKMFLVYWLHFPVLIMGTVQSVPDMVAHFGGDVTLSCLFPSQPRMNLDRLTLTWQKELEQARAEPRVVHSYYYGKDQLERQDAAYRNRTWLDAEGLARGNASLVLRGVRTQDEGVYCCHVASEQGSRTENWELRVGAPFSEPHLNVSLSSAGLRLTACTGGGYPAATVRWLDEAGGDIMAESTTEQRADEQGLYHVTSWVTVPPETRSAQLTFMLTPRVLGVPITRSLSLELSPGLLGPPASCLGSRLAVLCAACLFLLLLVSVFLCHLRQGPVGSCSRRKAEQEEPKEASCLVPAGLSSGQVGPAGHEQPAGAET